MRVVQQTTITKPVSLTGVGIHSGVPCRVTLRPESASRGVSFRRVAQGFAPASKAVTAQIKNISTTRLNTGLENGDGVSVGTIEHLMAALSLAGVDNLIVDIDGPELPALDGSAGPYLAAIERAGLKTLGSAREAIKIMAPIELRDGERLLRIDPFEGRIVDLTIDFPDAAIGVQRIVVDLANSVDVNQIGAARTFCQFHEVEQMRAAGLGLGGSLENAVIVDGGVIMNEEGLRHPQEFAYHKTLDLIGDLALAGAPIIGKITAKRPGHDLNSRFVRRILEDRTGFERVVASAGPALATV